MKIPTQQTLTIGGRVFTDLTNLIQVRCAVGGVDGNASFRKYDGTSGYLPSGSNNIRWLAYKAYVQTAGKAAITSSTNDCGIATTTTPTGGAFIGGDLDAGVITGGQAANTLQEGPLNWLVNNGEYTSIQGDGAVLVFAELFGYEEA